MVQINEFGHFCRQMVLLFIRWPNKQMIIVETHILLPSSTDVLLNMLQKAGIRVAFLRLKGETHVAPTRGWSMYSPLLYNCPVQDCKPTCRIQLRSRGSPISLKYDGHPVKNQMVCSQIMKYGKIILF